MAVLRSMSTSLFDKERITTTVPRAKALRPFAEKIITMSKREDIHARRLVARQIHDPKVVSKLFDTLSARYADRPGGYMRILRLGRRKGDGAELALLELVGSELVIEKEPEEKPKSAAARLAGRLRGGKKKKAEEAASGADQEPPEEK
jgi:large subunit ribosomal protein L17